MILANLRTKTTRSHISSKAASMRVYIHYFLVASLVLIFLGFGWATRSCCACVRIATDHCGRPIVTSTGEALYQTDDWATFKSNLLSNFSLTLGGILFAYFLYLEFRAFFPKKQTKPLSAHPVTIGAGTSCRPKILSKVNTDS